ncbi:rhodanese-like domain-containing protein [Aquisalimonas asiatica]|uniref:rhodanese-like domain-containing protein n=1 Tax=Aquisalimonas asiatica TaxID=406100 RepID=UPI001113FC30|nr:rhodanese-like domain-containing protein [Aquisalimonas asiatica]
MSGFLVALIAMPATGEDRVRELDFINDHGYREARFRAPLPDWHPEATVLDAAALTDLIQGQDPLLLDVMPRIEPGHPVHVMGLPPGAPRVSLPGSAWLPNAGHPRLDARVADRLERLLEERVRSREGARPVVVFCVTNCWMGWNAARRIARSGHEAVYWYPGGVDDWGGLGGDTEVRTPLME